MVQATATAAAAGAAAAATAAAATTAATAAATAAEVVRVRCKCHAHLSAIPNLDKQCCEHRKLKSGLTQRARWIAGSLPRSEHANRIAMLQFGCLVVWVYNCIDI